MVELVQELEKLPKMAEIDEMIVEARAGEYHDYKNEKYVCGKVAAVERLSWVAANPETPKEARETLLLLKKQIIEGEFDEYADEEDREMMRRDWPKDLWPMMGL